MFVRSIAKAASIVCAALAGAGNVRAQCSMPPETNFKMVSVIPGGTMSNPSHMTVLPNGEIFAIEQWSGKVWHYIPGGAAVTVGTVPTNAGQQIEDGMLGIAADPHFDTNHWLFIYHTPATMGTTRLERYTFTAGKIGNAKLIIELPRIRVTNSNGNGKVDERHAGGGLDFNTRTGDLFMSIGDDTYPGTDISKWGPRDPDNDWNSALRSAANTNDLRGKVLRIRPIPFGDDQTPPPGVGSTYSIPAGNLFPEGQNAGKTRPEIYTMGTRNAYRVKVDSLTGWAFIGEVGADADQYDAVKGPAGHDHLYLAKGPANFGWPFGNGNMEPYPVRSYEKDYLGAGMKVGDLFDLAHLKNLSKFNTGLTDLPPVTPPLLYYCIGNTQKGLSSKLGGGSETAMAGPMYDFNPDNPSTVKMPPYFHRKVIFGDYSRHYVWLVGLDTAGTLTSLERIKTNVAMTDIHMGPDGSIYLLDYDNGGVNSIQYTGSQYDYTACSWIKPGCTNPKYAEYDRTANMMKANSCLTPATAINAPADRASERMLPALAFGARSFVLPAGTTGAVAYDVHGTRVASIRGRAGQAVELPASAGEGVLFVKFTRD